MQLLVTRNNVKCSEKELPDADIEWVLGRQADTDFVLNAGDVSRRHAKLMRMGGALILDDLGSSGGIWQGADRLSGPVVLAVGDSFKIGPFLLQIQEGSVSADLAPVPATPPSAVEQSIHGLRMYFPCRRKSPTCLRMPGCFTPPKAWH